MAGQADGPAFTRFGQADATPVARAVTTTAPISLAGVATIGPGSATSWSGLVRGQREAGATVDISGLTLPGGVSLSGLHWEAVDQSTGAKRATATFTIARATGAGGLAVPTTDPSTTIAGLNAVLAPLGLALTAPRARTTGGTLFVDPLQISVVPSPTRDSIANAGMSAIQPIRQQVVAAVLQAFCRADNAVSISDVAIGSLTGAGSFTVSLGGVQAVSGEPAANAFNLGAGVGGLGPPTSPGGLGTTPSATGAAPLLPGTGPTGPAPRSMSSRPRGSAAIGPLRTVSSHGSHSGPLAAVALGALALVAVVAEGDRRFMGRGRRAMRFED